MLAQICRSLFCRALVNHEVPAHIVLDEPEVLAFLDIRPLFPGHVLVMPKRHVETLSELPPDLVDPLFGATRRLAGAVEAAMEADGSFIAINNRVSQSVPHLHVHVVPRKRKDGLRGFMWPRQRYADDAAMGDGGRCHPGRAHSDLSSAIRASRSAMVARSTGSRARPMARTTMGRGPAGPAGGSGPRSPRGHGPRTARCP